MPIRDGVAGSLAPVIDLAAHRARIAAASGLYFALRDLVIALATPKDRVGLDPHRVAPREEEETDRPCWGLKRPPWLPEVPPPPRRPAAKVVKTTRRHFAGRVWHPALCGALDRWVRGSFTESPRQVTCQRCVKKLGLQILTARAAGKPPRWDPAVEDEVLARRRSIHRRRQRRRMRRAS